MFDPAYAWVYAGVALLAVTAVVLALALFAHQVRQQRKLMDGRRRPVSPLPEVPPQRSPDLS
jgi:hypothetical protein